MQELYWRAARRATIGDQNGNAIMNTTSTAIFTLLIVGLVIAIAGSVWGLRANPRLLTHRVGLAIFGIVVLLPLAAFCLYGFAATFEPTSRSAVFWAFRIGYAVIGLGCIASALTFFTRAGRSMIDLLMGRSESREH